MTQASSPNASDFFNSLLAIMVGVSEYDSAGRLPGCLPDVDAIHQLLETSGRFDDLLRIAGRLPARTTKEQIVTFIEKHKGTNVDEFIFYYTGHGDLVGDEFYYLLSDYDPKRRNQTCIQNSEIDGFIRTLAPTLTVKIVDACHSGVAYVKSSDEFRSYLNKTASTGFQKLYFMFSSQADQLSYQNENISDFTRQIIDCISESPSTTVRYKDVIDYVSDAFQNETAQTPLFITQADFTETFLEVSTGLKELARKLVGTTLDAASNKFANTEVAHIVDMITKDADRYCDEKQAHAIVLEFRHQFDDRKASELLDALFTFSAVEETTESLPPNAAAIGRWLEENKDDRGYFAKAKKATRPVATSTTNQLRSLGLLGNIGALGSGETESYTAGYENTVKLPYTYFRVIAKPRFQNLNQAACYIVPILSRTHLRLFWGNTLFTHTGWDRISRVGALAWKTADLELCDGSSINATAVEIWTEFSEFLTAALSERWPQIGVVPGDDAKAKQPATSDGEDKATA